MTMFATRRFSDEIGHLDAGLGSTIATSVSTSSLSGKLFDIAKFRKYIFTLYTYGTAGKPVVLVYSCSTSVSSISSASSNWAAVDSANLQVSIGSAASVSSDVFCAKLEVRAEKLFSGVNPIRFIRPVVVMSSASSGSSSVNGYLTAHGMLPQYGPASYLEATGFTVAETDYL
jgi:hypothetical protein